MIELKMSEEQAKFATTIDRVIEKTIDMYKSENKFDYIRQLIMILDCHDSLLALITMQGIRNIIKEEHYNNYNALLKVILEECEKELKLK